MRTPVIIPACDEASLIGNTLAALSPDEFDPIVAVNGTTDRTADIAGSYRAKVITFEEQGKLPAIQGVLKTLGREALNPLIILDADTRPFMPRRWKLAMLDLLVGEAGDRPAVVGGPIWFNEGPPITSILSSLRVFFSGIAEKDDSSTIYQAGPNMGLKISSAALLDRILELPHYWLGEDRAIVAAVQAEGGRYFHPHNPSLLAGSRLPATWPTISKRLLMTKQQSIDYAARQYAQKAPAGSIPYNL